MKKSSKNNYSREDRKQFKKNTNSNSYSKNTDSLKKNSGFPSYASKNKDLNKIIVLSLIPSLKFGVYLLNSAIK